MFKYNGRSISPGKSWQDDNGVVHPGSWHIWDASQKLAMGITEVIYEDPPNSNLYVWSHDEDGKIIKTAKPLDDDGSTLGVKSILKREVKHRQGSLLSQTDWAIIRKADTGEAIDSKIQTWRDAIRSEATSMETAITNAADTDALEALFNSGVLYDFPELAED